MLLNKLLQATNLRYLIRCNVSIYVIEVETPISLEIGVISQEILTIIYVPNQPRQLCHSIIILQGYKDRVC